MHMQNLIKFHRFVHKILSRNEILTIAKGHNLVINLWKLTRDNPNLDLVIVNVYAKFSLISSICSQDIERKWSWNDRMTECSAYSNILKISPSKNENFQIKNSDIFHISAQNIDCGYTLELPHWGSSNEYPQSMFLSRNKKKLELEFVKHYAPNCLALTLLDFNTACPWQ